MKERQVRWDESRVQKAELKNFRLVFRGKSQQPEYKGGGLADLEPDEISGILGVVYWTDGDLSTLDRREGVYQRYPAGCCRTRVMVQTVSQAIAAVTYVRKHHDPPNPPHPAYLRKMVDAARYHGLAEEWIGEIRSAADRSRSGKRP